MPFIQTVTPIDRRLREWDGEPSDLLTIDKENIEVNTWARWRVTDPQKFYEALRTETAEWQPPRGRPPARRRRRDRGRRKVWAVVVGRRAVEHVGRELRHV